MKPNADNQKQNKESVANAQHHDMPACRNQTCLNGSSARDYLNLGRWLLQQSPEESEHTYLKAVNLLISGQTRLSVKDVELERDRLVGLNGDDPVLSPILSRVDTLLMLAQVVHFGDETIRYLQDRALHTEHFSQPVTIIAGGAEQMPDTQEAQNLELLNHVFKHCTGTVISGGTLSGIPGLVGQATVSLRNNNSAPEFHLFGYLPQHVPDTTRTDPRYDRLVYTTGSTFSNLEPLQIWTDLLAQGVRPTQVHLLGINGGTIAAFEYRLALALGARVGVVAGSGRAADALSLDHEWREHDNLIVLDNDENAINAFLHGY